MGRPTNYLLLDWTLSDVSDVLFDCSLALDRNIGTNTFNAVKLHIVYFIRNIDTWTVLLQYWDYSNCVKMI